MKSWLKEQQVLLSNQITQHCLPHAILINGAQGSGKNELAQWLVQVLHCQQPNINTSDAIQPLPLLSACGHCKCCQLYQSKTSPDHIEITALKNSIGVDSIRQASHFLEKKSQMGGNQTVLIPMAEKMTTSAANALLKTLEEPSDDSIIVLLSNDMASLLPTIISRCRLYTIRPLVGDALLSHELNQVLNHEVPNDVLLEHSESKSGVSQGQFKQGFVNLTHLPELTDENVKSQYDEFQRIYICYLLDKQGYNELLNQLVASAHTARWLEKISVNMMRNYYNWHNGIVDDENVLMRIKEEFHHERLWNIYQTIVKTNKQLKYLTQLNQQLLIEKLLLDIVNI